MFKGEGWYEPCDPPDYAKTEKSSVKIERVQTLHPAPYTIRPTQFTLHSSLYTLHPAPYTLHPKQPEPLKYLPYMRTPKLSILDSTPYTLNHKP